MANLSVCMISKFPPVQGGISAAVYWLARGLAEAGINVHIVTNSNCVEKDYRIATENILLPEGIRIHQVERDTPWHIPYSELYLDKLVDKALAVFHEYPINLIDTWYLVPYGVAGYLVHAINGAPYIVRHGGSDLAKFWRAGRFQNLFSLMFAQAAAVVSDNKEFAGTGLERLDLPRYVPDERYFHPAPRLNRPITCAYVGKINYHWQHKGLDRVVKLLASLLDGVEVIFLAQGRGKKDFIESCHPSGIRFMDFIPPWEMPAFLQGIDYLIYFTGANPLPDFPNIVLEALATGVKILTDNPAFLENVCTNILDPGANILDVSPFLIAPDPSGLRRFLEESLVSSPVKMHIRYSEYINANVEVYHKCIAK